MIKKSKLKVFFKDFAITFLILAVLFLINAILKNYIKDMIPIICVFSVFIVSVFTENYLWGIGISVVSVVLVYYYSVDPPALVGRFSLKAMVTAFIIFSVAIITSTLTARLKSEKNIKYEAYTERMRANLMRAVGHDLRTPLTTIYASASAICENYDTLTFEQRMSLVKDIQEESGGLVRMVENILSVTRLNQEGVKITKKAAVLEELIDSVLIKFKKHFPTVKVNVEIPEEFVSIPMDVILIEQVLMNLMENAVDHAVGMTHITLRVAVNENEALFEVSDDGCGIPKDKLDKLFSQYFPTLLTGQNIEKRNMGIGLSTCADIIAAHNGKIYAKNHKEGGAGFYFVLKMEEQ